MIVNVHYDSVSRYAEFFTEELGEEWMALRHLLNDASSSTRVINSNKLVVPWWVFLAVREPFKHLLQRTDSTMVVSDSARRQLVSARAREVTYSAPHAFDGDITTSLHELGFRRELSEEQFRNVTHLVQRKAGATFSVPGAGKTTEALAFFALQARNGEGLLVIAPKNAFAAWEEQLALCLPQLENAFVRLRGGETSIRFALAAQPRFLLINYQQFLVEGVHDAICDYLSSNPFFVFLDESHRIKGGVGKPTADSVLSLAHIASGKLVMSGTPMPNSTSDLVPQFKFLYPEVPTNPSTVVSAIRPLFVRTTKEELQLPPVNRYERLIPMSNSQRALYDVLKSEAARQAHILLRSSDRGQLRKLGRSAMKLLQVASNPSLLSSDLHGVNQQLLRDCITESDAPKIAFVCERARTLASEGRKVVIWTSFVENVELISRRLEDIGADYIHGGVDTGSDEEEETREFKIRQFHEDSNRMVLVANPAAASEGISLHTVCNNAIYVDRNYNAAQYLQSEDRIHRFGSVLPAFIEILVAHNTIDESVSRRLKAKVSRMAQVLDDEHLNIEAVPLDFDSDGFDEDDARDLALALI